MLQLQMPFTDLNLNTHKLDLMKKLRNLVKQGRKLITNLNICMHNQNDMNTIFEKVINESGLIEHHMKEKGEKGRIRVENINELISAVKSFELINKHEDMSDYDSFIAAFLSSVSLDMGDTQASKTDDAVQLMTMHSAKGLEYKYVFMVGMEESLFPHSRSMENINELEEERRLCYVGITRARNKLFLTYTEFRRLYGQDSYNPPSRFINEIPAECLEFVRPKQTYKNSFKIQRTPMNLK